MQVPKQYPCHYDGEGPRVLTLHRGSGSFLPYSGLTLTLSKQYYLGTAWKQELQATLFLNVLTHL